MNRKPEIYEVPSERDFTASMLMTSIVILVIAVAIAATVTWYTTRGYDGQIHNQAMRTAIILPLIIVPLCTGIVGYQSVRNHRRMLAVSKLARTDEMTGLANRRAFMHAATVRFDHTDFEYSGLAMMIIDLDHFKQVNDVHGHDAGDEVLIHASQQIAAACPEDCLVARLGGEEFAVLMPYETIAELHANAEAIRARVAATPCAYQGKDIHVSASLGVGIAHPRDSVSSVLSRADNALYEAKDRGRNRFQVAA
ncbi:MAG: GGDEF domain-containing protein [Pseudomonadota bacterium]